MPATSKHASHVTTNDLVRKAGSAVVIGALALSLSPLPVLAATGDASATSTQQSSAPEPPSGQAPSGSALSGQAPSGEAPGGMPQGEAPSGGAPGGGADTMSFDYQGTYSGALTADGESVDSANESATATEADQNAALAQNGGTLTISSGTLQKSGDDTNGDNCNLYGVNSIALATGEGSKLSIRDTALAATSEGSNGVFATDSATAYVNNSSISTTAGNSRGLDATYGGTIIANQMEITTQGDHCAGVATDRGGGYVSLTNSSIETNGSGSPLLYSTGDIEASGVTGTATGSQIAGMEGLNTILINDCSLTSTNTSTTGSDPVANGVIIYQSTSGDAEATTGDAATFQAVDSTLKSEIESGSMFYLTNTTANVLLQNTTLDFDTTSANLIQAEGNDANNWGTAGSNGATVNFTGRNQQLAGNVSVDTISSVNLFLLDGTTWTGAASITQNENGSTSEAPLTVNVDGSSTWVVTADTTVSALNVANGGKVVDADGKSVTIVANGQTVVQGDSDLTVTVAGSYGTEVTTSEANDVATETIDRSGFDEEFGTQTSFSLGSSADEGTTQQASADAGSSGPEATDEATASAQGGSASVWDSIVSFFKGIFGMA